MHLQLSCVSSSSELSNRMRFRYVVHAHSGVGSGGAPGAGAPPLFNRAPADLASFPGRFVGGGQSAWERGYHARIIYNEL